jgi:hypothetical protein
MGPADCPITMAQVRRGNRDYQALLFYVLSLGSVIEKRLPIFIHYSLQAHHCDTFIFNWGVTYESQCI